MDKFGKNFIILLVVLCLCDVSIAQRQVDQYVPEDLYVQAKQSFDNGQLGSALIFFDQYLSYSNDKNADPQHLEEAEFLAALISVNLGNTDGQSRVVRFVENYPTSSFAIKANTTIANFYFSRNQYRDAITYYKVSSDEQLSTEEADEYYFKYGYSLMQTGSLEEAKTFLKRAADAQSLYSNESSYYYAHICYLEKDYVTAKRYLDKVKNDPRYQAIVPIYLIQINQTNGDYASVVSAVDQAMMTADENSKATLAIVAADANYQLKNFDKCIDYYRQATQKNPVLSRETEFRFGYCLMKTGSPEEAIEHLQRAAEQGDDKLTQYASYYLAQCLVSSHQERQARAAFAKAYRLKHDAKMSEDALFNYARLSLLQGVDPFGGAAELLQDYLRQNPATPNKHTLLELMVNIYANAKKYDKTLVAMNKMSDMSSSMKTLRAQIYYQKGVDAFKKGSFRDASIAFGKVVDDANAPALLRAQACYYKAESYLQNDEVKNGETTLIDFIKMPAAIQTQEYKRVHYDFGHLFINQQDFVNAAKELKFFLNNGGNGDKNLEDDAWLRLGDCYFIQKKYREAIAAYASAVKQGASEADYALYQQGLGYGASNDNKTKINTLKELTTKYRNSSFYDKALFEIAKTYLETSDQRSAIATYNRLVKDRPRSSLARKALIEMGMLYYDNQQYDKALEVFKSTAKNYPSTDEGRQALDLVKKIYAERNATNEFLQFVEKEQLVTTKMSKQDSLAFKNAEKSFKERNYEAALSASRQYIKDFPQGANLLKINHFIVVAVEKLGREDDVTANLEFIVNQPLNDYSDDAILRLAKKEYEAKHYEQSLSYFERLLEVTELMRYKNEAAQGLMDCVFALQQYSDAYSKAAKILQSNDFSGEMKKRANYVAGVSKVEMDNYAEALPYLESCVKNDEGVLGAEASYYIVVALSRQKKYAETEKRVFNMAERYALEADWVARSFIVLGDTYMAQNNSFQAKETYRNVVDNSQNETIRREAQDKLNNLN